MAFYQSITPYYEQIFPIKMPQVKFVSQIASDRHYQSLLDIGCATGAFAHAMTSTMARVDAFDLDQEMIQFAKENYHHSSLRYEVGNMLNTAKIFPDFSYNLATCFGNTLVHLPSDKIDSVFKQLHSLLTPGGSFIGQILNYDYVLDHHITHLPLIDNELLTFTRVYQFHSQDTVSFQTTLRLKTSGKENTNAITLYPIRRNELINRLASSGFVEIQYYQNYQSEPAGGNHLPLIFTALKK